MSILPRAAVALLLLGAACESPSNAANDAPAAVANAQPNPSYGGFTNQPSDDQFSVKVTRSDGSGVPGVAVEWAVVSGDGTVQSPQSTTAASGIASAGWRFGGVAGEQVLEARVQGFAPVRFTARVLRSIRSVQVPDSVRLTRVLSGVPFPIRVLDDTGAPVNAEMCSVAFTVPGIAEYVREGVWPRKPGRTEAVVTCQAKADTAVVVVAPVAASLTAALPFPGGGLLPGESNTLAVQAVDSGGVSFVPGTVSFASSAPGVATVDSTGGVRGVAPGVTEITVTGAGTSGLAALRVYPLSPLPEAVSVVPNSGGYVAQDVAATRDGGVFQLYRRHGPGDQPWVVTTRVAGAAGGFSLSGQSVSLALGDDGTAYVRVGDGLRAFTAAGAELWHVDACSRCLEYTSARSIAVGADGTVFVSVPQGVLAVSPAGATRWTASLGIGTPQGLAVTAQGVVYAWTAQRLAAVGADGAKLWERSLAREPGGAAVDAGGAIYLSSSPQSAVAGRVTEAFGPDGVRRWSTGAASGWVVLGADGSVVLTSDGTVTALDPATGVQRWRSDRLDIGAAASPMVANDGRIYVSSGCYVFVLNGATGAVVGRNGSWVCNYGGAVAGGGTLFVSGSEATRSIDFPFVAGSEWAQVGGNGAHQSRPTLKKGAALRR